MGTKPKSNEVPEVETEELVDEFDEVSDEAEDETEEAEDYIPLVTLEFKQALANALVWIDAQVIPTIGSGNEAHVLELRKLIVGAGKAIGKTRNSFDTNLDLVRKGNVNGSDFLKEVTRIFAPKVGAGRKAKPKPSLIDTL